MTEHDMTEHDVTEHDIGRQPSAEEGEPPGQAAREPVPSGGPPPSPRRGVDARSVAIGAGAVVLVLAVAAVAFGAGRLGWPGGGQLREETMQEGWQRSGPPADMRGPTDRHQALRRVGRSLPGPAFLGLGGQRAGLHEMTISAIEGSTLTLTTADGWTRTITVTDETTISRAGSTITLADLAVGDRVRFRQTRQDDGSYIVTAVHVVLPSVVGRITATTGDTLTVTRRDGTTMTIRVSSETTYRVRGVSDAALADVSVGMVVVAAGTQNADGSLQALAVVASSGP